MATCEICGKSGELLKTKVEGTTLELCDDCQDLGEVTETASSSSTSTASTSTSTTTTSSSRSRSQRNEPGGELVEDFDTRVKQAREQQDLSPQDLADQIKEKESVVHRVETGKLSPDQRLAQKLENALDITLYDNMDEVTGYNTDTDTAGGPTIGDVAEVRDRS